MKLVSIFFLFLCNLVALGQSEMVFMVESGENDRQIAIAQSDGSQLRLMTGGETWHLYPDIDSTGRYVTWVQGKQEDLGLVVFDRKHQRLEHWSGRHARHLHPHFSGNGKFLAFSRSTDGTPAEIGIINLEDVRKKQPEVLPDGTHRYRPALEKIQGEGKASLFFPQLSSDGSFVIFQQTNGKDRSIYHYDRTTKKRKRLTAERSVAMAPSLSFDDTQIAYTQFVDGKWNIHIQNWRTQQSVQITQGNARDFAPTFRPDGGLVFASDRDGQFKLYQIKAENIRRKDYRVELLLEQKGSLYAPSVSGERHRKQGELASIPKPARSSFGTARIGNRLYIIGGHQGPEHTYPKESFLARVDYYDLDTRQWHKGTPRPIATQGFETAVRGKYIYVFGGFAFSDKHKPGWQSIANIDRYDTQTHTWKTVGQLPRKRSSNVVAQIGDKAYLIGGWDATPKKLNDVEGHFHREIDVFDLATETITTSSATLPNPLRRAFSSVVYQGRILLLGGLGQGASHFELLDRVTEFHPETGNWNERTPLPFATFAPAAGILGTELFVFGGMFRTGKFAFHYVNHIFAYPLEGPRHHNYWRHTGRYLNETKAFGQVLQLDGNQLGILGGHSYEGGDAPVATFETFGTSR